MDNRNPIALTAASSLEYIIFMDNAIYYTHISLSSCYAHVALPVNLQFFYCKNKS